MKSQMKTIAMGSVLLASTLILAQNCGGFAASGALSSKQQLISGTFFASSIIRRDNKCYESTPTGAEQEVPCPTPPPENPEPTATPEISAPAPTPLDVDLVCSQDGVTKAGGSLRTTSSNLVYKFKDDSGSTICTVTEEGGREAIINTGKIQLDKLAQRCPTLTPGKYTMEMRGEGKSTKSLLMTIDVSVPPTADRLAWIGNPFEANLAASGANQLQITAAAPAPCANLNPYYRQFLPGNSCDITYGANAAKVIFDNNPDLSTAQNVGLCDVQVSPLLIQLGKDPSPIRLTAPLNGVQFDIMGVNAKPAHKPLQISWLADDSVENNYFLVLPNQMGGVEGIDELFGDNTVGPDGETASNGYAALRKWDGRSANGRVNLKARDGFIRENDPIFGHLRLWSDTNRDAIVQASELHTLDSLDVTSIDLNYDPQYSETDMYGNQIKMKSVVETSDGQLHRVYDIWFRALNL